MRISNVKFMVDLLLKQGLLVSMKKRGRGKPGGLNYHARLSDWIPDVGLDEITRNEAMARLIKLYTQSYGPVTSKDIGWWSGIKMSNIREMLDSLESILVQCEISGLESQFMMPTSDFRQLKS